MTVKHNEAWVKLRVKDILVSRKAYYFMPSASKFGRSGVPDFVVCYKGKFIGIETKANGNTTSPLQDVELSLISKAGGATMIVDEYNYTMVANFLDRLDI